MRKRRLLKSCGGSVLSFLFVPMIALCAAMAQTQARSPVSKPIEPKPAPALIRTVKVVPGKSGPAVEIVTTRPVSPEITTLENPDRLVVDLSLTVVSSQKNVTLGDEEMKGIRVSQFQKDPAIARIVIDLRKPSGYSWDAAGNKLTIRLKPPGSGGQTGKAAPESPSETTPDMVPSHSPGPHSVSLGAPLTGGSSVTAGAEPAVLRLPHGGEIRVCPGTTISTTFSQNGRDMMMGVSTGSLEAHYRLGNSADSLITPDFRILLAGPGEFDFGFRVDSRGNTCVRALPGNAASAIVSELMGDRIYQVKPAEQVVFHQGRLASVVPAAEEICGCPESSIPVLRTGIPPAGSSEERATAAGSNLTSQVSVARPESMPLPAAKPGDVHVQIDAPFVFRAGDTRPEASQPPPAPAEEISDLKLSYLPDFLPAEFTVLPPPPQVERHGFLGKLKGFFAGIFH